MCLSKPSTLMCLCRKWDEFSCRTVSPWFKQTFLAKIYWIPNCFITAGEIVRIKNLWNIWWISSRTFYLKKHMKVYIWKHICYRIGFKVVKSPLIIFQKIQSNFFRCIFLQLNWFLLTLLHEISVSNNLNKKAAIFAVINWP